MSYNFNNTNLLETTSQLQASRGNRSFIDTSNNVKYISYANGYVRRELNVERVPGFSVRMQYQLNTKKMTPLQGVKRVAIAKEEDRLALIDSVSNNYVYRGFRSLIK